MTAELGKKTLQTGILRGDLLQLFIVRMSQKASIETWLFPEKCPGILLF